MIVYGLHTCALSQRAYKALVASGQSVSFRDIRENPLTEAELATLLAEFGDRLVDKTTNDWRALSDWLKHAEAEDQIAAKPKLMARPVIFAKGTYHLGWDDSIETALRAP